MTTQIIKNKEAALTNQLADIMQEIADLVETHPDADKVAKLYAKMARYEQKFPMTVSRIKGYSGIGAIWHAVKIACGPFRGTAKR